MAELWDAYNKDFTKIEGTTLVRGQHIPDNIYHLVCDIIVRHVDGTYLIMQRDHEKTHGGQWELSAGGSALQGEGPEVASKRELKEETGIEGTLREIGRMSIDKNHSIYVLYLCETDCKKDSIVLQEGETIDYRWISRDELLAMTDDELISYRAMKLVHEQNI
ncbi:MULTISPECIES: NUDIX hydrolase [Pseudobutyrivibrio]|uniref:ADP-ribose pyrophosphatase YjhB, NUDIX family n=1 Tax=Pseudobutyrivibrio xylanivorans TaxID=185007 RepID=A0A1G5S450_PSEXY|nr:MULTISPECIES: NUDIX domain-containing protein [Pseudobutyrivibrio]MDC7280120.1 NUDIX domain-containing protein [Butyrivibrio fibrisolvens]SCZ81144.1 ADP-ribose pyrophosphatase YjhB, NUDIX family [Pseudobutyrivibrio xylanivorans]